MTLRRLAIYWLLTWFAYAMLVFAFSALEDFWEPGPPLGQAMAVIDLGVSLGTALGVGLAVMERVRRGTLKKWQAVSVVLLTSAVSALAPPMVWTGATAAVRPGVGMEVGFLLAFTLLIGVVNFVAFSIGILCLRVLREPGA
jgi:hypothetical protein